ncbi:hypothetical protein GCM10025868_14010 [Angustibacter aerolatus]|uniref:FAD-binding oxidoreductase/transferase type 4 C-terminal domain-containing protein n=1 Tax=Angustibacter aerolatus TaxID=1162965 RepID=A0ABQ6JHB0_9ACTN|nr:hypothetical protein GCM10025868_14010 [Angustibacter aerolatus]
MTPRPPSLVAAFEAGGASWAAASTDPDEAEALFAARRLAYPALERLGPLLTEDVCVPVAAVPEMLSRIQASARRHDTHIANIAHAGDGNLHPLIIVPAGDDDARRRAVLAFDEVIADALALGGTVTGEHGVGLLKMDGLRQEPEPGGAADAPRGEGGARPGRHPEPGQGRCLTSRRRPGRCGTSRAGRRVTRSTRPRPSRCTCTPTGPASCAGWASAAPTCRSSSPAPATAG